MKEFQAIIVGGGPAGAAAGYQLGQKGISTLILDKKKFPRPKICAGWVTPGVFKALGVMPQAYPHSLKQFNRLNYHLFGLTIPVRTCQYAIRRVEFDHWMLKRAKVCVRTHTVKQIKKENAHYVIDETYRCKYLIGAGGTYCPVFKQFFKNKADRSPKALITAVEKEFLCDHTEDSCHLWFFENRLPGYAWYLPKANGYLNIGIGGKFFKLKKQGKTIMDHWAVFTEKLEKLSLVKKRIDCPKGYHYYIRQKISVCRIENAFIIGDALGLSTHDMGEGIHSAITSGIQAADAITTGAVYSPCRLPKFSLPGIFLSKKPRGIKNSSKK